LLNLSQITQLNKFDKHRLNEDTFDIR